MVYLGGSWVNWMNYGLQIKFVPSNHKNWEYPNVLNIKAQHLPFGRIPQWTF